MGIVNAIATYWPLFSIHLLVKQLGCLSFSSPAEIIRPSRGCWLALWSHIENTPCPWKDKESLAGRYVLIHRLMTLVTKGWGCFSQDGKRGDIWLISPWIGTAPSHQEPGSSGDLCLSSSLIRWLSSTLKFQNARRITYPSAESCQQVQEGVRAGSL